MAITSRTIKFTNAASTGTDAASAVALPSRYAGKWYFELTIDVGLANRIGGGCVNSNWTGLSPMNFVGSNNSFGYLASGGFYVNGTLIVTLQTFSSLATIRFAIDLDLGKAYVQVPGGLWNNNILGDPVEGIGGIDISTVYSSSTPLVPAATMNTLNEQITGRFTTADLINTPPTGYTAWTDGVAAAGIIGTRTGTFGGAPTTGQFGVSIILIPASSPAPPPPAIPFPTTPQQSFEVVYTTSGDGSFTVPLGVLHLDTVEAWGGGGAGGDSGGDQGAGGGSGGYSTLENVSVSAGMHFSFHVATGGTPNYLAPVLPAGSSGPSGEDTWWSSTAVLLAKGGTGGKNDSGGTGITPGGVGGQASLGVGLVKFSGASGGRGKAGR